MKRKINLTIAKERLPESIKAFSSKRGDQDYLIVIGDDLTDDEATKAFIHECLHIWRDDYGKFERATNIEADVRKEIKRLVYDL